METTVAAMYSKWFGRKRGCSRKGLGASYARERTVFKVWSPDAERVRLSLYQDGTSGAYDTLPLHPEAGGMWTAVVHQDLHGVYYDYEVTAAGRTVRTADPYALACGRNGARSMVVDLARTDPAGFTRDAAPPLRPEQVIYELHVKDFSHDPDSGVPEPYRGKFKAFSWRDGDRRPARCMEHLKSLGVTHVQLLPIFDFASVDEGGDGSQFNWGYDPMNYNIPEGSYATDPDDGAVRIRECKEMIQALHRSGLRVVMDVVYNHTYASDSWLERSAPGCYYRRWSDGGLSNGSGCGNDVAAGRTVVDDYIVDSVLYWAREYHVDGFRFDLMGLLTVELMNRIRRELDAAFGPGEKLLYGEPWRAADSPMEPGTNSALKENTHLLDPSIAVFCDNTRDAVKGDCFHTKAAGFVNGGDGRENAILNSVTAWREGCWGFAPQGGSQIINYVSCHDNYTLWDKLVHCSTPGQNDPGADAFSQYREDLLEQNKLAAFICFTCLGRPFFQAGEEFGRTKLGDGNSYRSNPEVNMLRWERAWRFGALTDYYRGLIRLRQSLPGLCDKSPTAAERITDKTVHASKVVSFQVDGGGPHGERLLVVYNASGNDYGLTLPTGQWIIRADGRWADQHSAAGYGGDHITTPRCSGMLLQRVDHWDE